MKKKHKDDGTFGELYWVKLNYQKPDGLWVFGHTEEVVVRVRHGIKEKDNHREAERIAKSRFPRCEIKAVIYC